MAKLVLLVWICVVAGPGFGYARAQAVTYPRHPAHGNGVALIAAQGLRAVDLTSGHTRWKALSGLQLFEPTLVDDRVYIGSSDGLFALDAATGDRLWHAGEGHTLFSPVRVGERLFSGSMDGTLWALDAVGGALLWRRQLAGWVYTPAWIDGCLVTGGSAQRLWALDAADGHVRWTVSLDQELVYRPVAAGDGLVVTTFAGTVAYYDASGRLGWRMNEGVASLSPVVFGNRLLTAGMDGSVRLRRLEDGRLLARGALEGRIVRPAVVAGSRALLVSEAGEAGVFSLQTQGWVARRQLPSGSALLPLAVDGRFMWLGAKGPPLPWPLPARGGGR